MRTIVTGIFILKWQHQRSVLVHQMKIIYQNPICTSICVLDSSHLPTMIFRLSFFYYSTMVKFFFLSKRAFWTIGLFTKVVKKEILSAFHYVADINTFYCAGAYVSENNFVSIFCHVRLNTFTYGWGVGEGEGIQMINIPKCTGRPNSIL